MRAQRELGRGSCPKQEQHSRGAGSEFTQGTHTSRADTGEERQVQREEVGASLREVSNVRLKIIDFAP